MRNAIVSAIAAILVVALWESVRPAAASGTTLAPAVQKMIAESTLGFTPSAGSSSGGGCQAGVNCSALSFTASAASGQPAVEVVQGARVCLNYPTCSRHVSFDGSNIVLSGPGSVGGSLVMTGGYSNLATPTWSVGSANQTATYRATRSAGANAVQHRFYSDAAMGSDDAVVEFYSGNATAVARVTGDGAFAPEGVATASLPTCNSTAPSAGGTRGEVQYDTTTNTLVYCNGTAWKTLSVEP